jgi:hypothetical protein
VDQEDLQSLGNKMDTQIDPKIKNLVSAIGQAETGTSSPDAYTKRGASGEFGRYQFMPDTWKMWAKEHLGDENAQPTIENQNKVAYAQVKQWKDEGLNPAQIASKWNSGNENAYKQGVRGTNSQGVTYDVPAYTQKVSQYYQQLSGNNQSNVSQILNKGYTPTTNVEQQRENLEAQGEPVSVNPEKTNPTIAGSIIRGLLKTPARLATNVVQAGEILTGKDVTEPFSGSYLGNVSSVGTKGTFGQKLKDTLGTGLELASYIVGSGEAKAGLEAAKAGQLFTKGILKTAGKGALEGTGIGALGGAGQGLQENKGTSGVLKDTLSGAVGGGITGGILGSLGGIISKAKGITTDTIDLVKNRVGKDYVDSLTSAGVSGRKVLTENADGMKASIDAGIFPDVNVTNGSARYDTTEATTKLQTMMDELGKARGADIKAHNQPVDTNVLKQRIINNVNEFVKDPLEQQKVGKTVGDWFNALGKKKLTLEKLNELQVAVGKKAKFENESDAVIRNAYRNIYHGIGNFINETVGGQGGVNKEVNDTLTKYHGIMDFLDAIHEKPIKDKGLINILGSHAAKMGAIALGSPFGGAGSIVASESLPIIQKMMRKIIGSDNSAYSKVMEAIRSGEQKKIDAILKQIEKNKGSKMARDIKRALQEVPQLTSGVLPKGRKEIYTPINLGGISQIEKPAQKIHMK